MDDDFLPGWVCVYDEEGGFQLAQEVLANNGIGSEVVPVGSHGKYSMPTLWVRQWDYDRAVELLYKMTHEFHNPPATPWLCRCGETIEGQFDICWKCGKEKSTG